MTTVPHEDRQQHLIACRTAVEQARQAENPRQLSLALIDLGAALFKTRSFDQGVAALDEAGTNPAVMRLRNGAVEKVNVTLGVRDEATERVELLSGVAAGDTVLLGGARRIAPNTQVRVAARDAAPQAPQR